MGDEIVILITAGSEAEAESIGRALVDDHLAACVNIIPGVRSFFFWDGKTQAEEEVLMVLKSRVPLVSRIVSRVKKMHSYTVPEVIALPIVGGSSDYLAWVSEATKG